MELKKLSIVLYRKHLVYMESQPQLASQPQLPRLQLQLPRQQKLLLRQHHLLLRRWWQQRKLLKLIAGLLFLKVLYAARFFEIPVSRVATEANFWNFFTSMNSFFVENPVMTQIDFWKTHPSLLSGLDVFFMNRSGPETLPIRVEPSEDEMIAQ